MAGIFISYRREDSPGHAGRIFDRLRSRFGSDVVFMDVAAIEAGVDFVDVLHKAVGSCDALLAVIGPQWLSATSDGKRRLDDPHDFVRIEIAGALQRNVRVLPVLVDGARLPSTAGLPTDLQGLTRRQAIELRDARWDDDIDRLVEGLEKVLKVGGEAPAPTAAVAADRANAKTSTGRWIAIGAGAVLMLVVAAVVAWRGGLVPGNRSGTSTDPPRQTVSAPPASQQTVTPTANPAPPPARGSTPSPGPANAAVPDVTGKRILEAREILRNAGFRFLVRLSAGSGKAPGTVISQALDESTGSNQPRRVLLTAVPVSSIVVHVAKGDEQKAEALVNYLRDVPSTIGSIVRSQAVVPRAEIIGRVGYSEDRLAAQAEAVAKDASEYLARSGTLRTLQATLNPRVARGAIIVGLYERAQ